MSGQSGGILELIARGKKDVFFTHNPVVSYFHSVYVRAAPFTKEIYVEKPRNVPEWGQYVDFDIQHRGDTVGHFYLRVTLPTWLPSHIESKNGSSIVTDLSGVSYGYTNRIGFMMIDKIQFFNDQVCIHETYGEYLDWKLRQSYTNASTFIIGDQIGSHDESLLGIARSASRRSLRIPLPLLGWQHLKDPGLPLAALKNTRFRIRVHFRRLDELLVASDGRLRPQPWNRPFLIQDGPTAEPVQFTTLPKEKSMVFDVALEQTYTYLPPDVQVYLKAQTLRIPYKHVQHTMRIVEDNLLTAAAEGAANLFRFPIDFVGSMDRMLLGFRTVASTRAGQLTNLHGPRRAANATLGNDNARFVNSIRLNIANIDRIQQFPTFVFREIAAYWKNHRMGLDLSDPSRPQELYTLTFGGFDDDEPAGTINFTRAVLPTLYCTLNAIPYDERLVSRETQALLYGEAWNIYEIKNGRGAMMFES